MQWGVFRPVHWGEYAHSPQVHNKEEPVHQDKIQLCIRNWKIKGYKFEDNNVHNVGWVDIGVKEAIFVKMNDHLTGLAAQATNYQPPTIQSWHPLQDVSNPSPPSLSTQGLNTGGSLTNVYNWRMDDVKHFKKLKRNPDAFN